MNFHRNNPHFFHIIKLLGNKNYIIRKELISKICPYLQVLDVLDDCFSMENT